MKVSKFIKVNKNILIEYIYDDNNNIGDSYKILLNSRDNIPKYSYIAGDLSTTNNVVTNQLFNIDQISNTFGLINTQNYSFLQLKDYSAGFPIKHDKIKIHLPVNYTFGEYIGCYIKVFTFDYSNKKTYELSNFFFDISDTNTQNLVNFSNPALFFQEKMWGKFIEVNIPSPRAVSAQREGNGAKENTLNYNLTEGFGLSITAPIFIDFHFINQKRIINKITNYYLSPKTTINLPQSPDFEKIGLKIQHSNQGDYFEIFGTYNGNISEFNTFIENSITIGKRYYVEYNVTLFEQNIRGKSIKFNIQENFNEKVEFRPIIKFSTTTAIIDVEMNLIDAVDGNIIQRRASYGMLQDEVAKYSINLTKINLEKANKPKIYNIKSPEGAGIFGNLNGLAYSDGRLYANAGGSLFSNNVSKNLFGSRNAGLSQFAGVNQRNLFSRAGGRGVLGPGGIPIDNQTGINQISDTTKTQVILEPFPVNFTTIGDKFNIIAKSENVKVGRQNFYGVGRLKIMIQPFDHLIQFIIAQDISTEQSTQTTGTTTNTELVSAPKYMDLTNMGEIKLVFKNTKSQVEFKLYTQSNSLDLTKGQIVFRISQNKINEIRQIYDSGINVFYITSNLNSLNTVIYSGLFTLYDSKENVNIMNEEQLNQESVTGNSTEASIINTLETRPTGTAIVTRRLIRGDGAATVGGNGAANATGNNVANQNTVNLTNTSTATAIKMMGVTYEIDSSSNLKIDGYLFTPNDIKKVLGLTELPVGLIIKTDTLFSKDKLLEKLPTLKEKLESSLQTQAEKDKLKQVQQQTRGELGTDVEFSYYSREFNVEQRPFNNNGVPTTPTVVQNPVTTDFSVLLRDTDEKLTYVSKDKALNEIRLGDLFTWEGKTYTVTLIDYTLENIYIEEKIN